MKNRNIYLNSFFSIIFFLILLFNVPLANASTIYSNNLTTDFWNTFYAPCTTSNSGLTCTSPADAVNTTYFPTLACVTGNFTSNGGPNQLFILDQNTNFDSYVVLYIQSGHNLELNSNAGTIFDSATQSPSSGIHTYALCKSSDTYTSYLDGTLVQTQTFTGHTGGYIGFQTANGEFLTNFLATDNIPNSPNQTLLYSNNFTSDFWNTFFGGTCIPSNLGITCNSTSVMNTTQLSTVKCISVDADSSIGSPQLLFAENPLLQNVIAVDFNNNSDILIKDINDNNFHSGVLVPSGAHNYGICQGTNQIKIYIDNSLVYTFNTIFPHLDYIGFTLYSGTNLTHFIATDTFPGNSAPSVGAITVNTSPTQVNNMITAAANFTDSDSLDTHTALWNWGDGSSSTGAVTENSGSGSVSNTHVYTTAGVYTVTLTVTDDGGLSNTSSFQYVSVYNPTSQGLFSAGQHFTSPTGAYSQNPNITGSVKFGLSYKYQGIMPVSDRQFTMNFNAANLTFNATTISSFVVSNNIATLTGSGTINGAGNYSFLVTGVNGGDLRIKITDSNNNVIYDTQPGEDVTATPTTSVIGNVVVHN